MAPPGSLRIGEEEVREDRFSRFRLIPWWDQKKLQCARALVIGAGALGNEILKNLALLGFEQMVVVDLDRIEESNLSRTILFNSSDVGAFKADVALVSDTEMYAPGLPTLNVGLRGLVYMEIEARGPAREMLPVRT